MVSNIRLQKPKNAQSSLYIEISGCALVDSNAIAHPLLENVCGNQPSFRFFSFYLKRVYMNQLKFKFLFDNSTYFLQVKCSCHISNSWLGQKESLSTCIGSKNASPSEKFICWKCELKRLNKALSTFKTSRFSILINANNLFLVN